MNEPSRIVHDATIATLLGGGALRPEDVEAALRLAPRLVCADGGVNHALRFGLRPEAVIGDLDSMDPAAVARSGIPVIEAVDQDLTDFEKSLALIGAPVVLAVGFLGARLDHQLAAITAVMRARQTVVLIGPDDVALPVRGTLALDLAAGTRVSLWPVTPVRGQSTGLAWPIDGLSLDPVGRIGCSNVASGGPVGITLVSGQALLLLPRDQLENVVASVTSGR